MLQKGPAKKVTIWVNEETRHHLEPLWLAVFEYLRHKRIAGASVTHTKLAFGDRKRIHNADAAETAEFSYRVEFVESPERVEEVLPTLYEMVVDGLIEVHDTTVIKSVNKDRVPQVAPIPVERTQQKAKLMRIFLGERDKWHGEPLYDAIVKRLRMMDIAGATVYQGIMGYGAKGETHRPHLLHISEDLPIMISVIDSPLKIAEAEPMVEGMLEDGLIVISDVDIIRLIHPKVSTEAPDAQR
jgi:PII-like signaling protein